MSQNPIGRRSFLRKSALAGGAATAGVLAAPPVVGQSPITMRMQTSWPASNIWQQMAQQYADRVEAMSGGRIQVDLLPAGAVVGAFQVIDAVSDGGLDASHSVSAYWYGKNRAASLFGTGPVFGQDARNLQSWFYAGDGKQLFDELVRDEMGLNVDGYFGMPMPAQPFGWFTSPFESMSDIEGSRYRTVGLATNLLQNMGLSVAQLPGGEIVPAMERGVLDAFEFNNPSSDRDFGAQDVASNYYLGSFHQANEMFEYLFNQDFMDSLDDDLRAILIHSVEAASTANYALALDQYSADLQWLQNEGGVTVHRTPQSVMDQQLVAWEDLISELEEEDIMRRILDSQRSWVERTAYYELMNAPDYQAAYNHFFPETLKL
ncbi:Tat (twin-arginine translocation) pathway signal sequence [Tranquillimonas rosea]|uniref:Tat (Twin-arginine translocation) pathway signal sequence n=1 Tax=Tranquillimonas rosea TaxID=641238 RepID=A0A1H9SUY5_9RHOB|nr:TRAP transporter substrate-binding protein [Tranquillimonas rosea]SER88169.1 Tat (twin-arginine translocation) pathway signal sequence [Tranquillimonas rosea]